eukprot:m.91695 g.91695  ORF g.91695 m.91695 type:complete len:65 (+) comp11973_c0_seq1:818-1012(+)
MKVLADSLEKGFSLTVWRVCPVLMRPVMSKHYKKHVGSRAVPKEICEVFRIVLTQKVLLAGTRG